MFEAALVLTVGVLGFLVRTLFLENKQIRSDLESRLKAIEGLEGPFARTLADAGPAPLKHALHFAIHLDTRFSTETLQLTPAELDEVKASIRVHDDLSKKAGAKDFDKWFYGDILVRIQEWRGGYTHVEVKYPLCPSEKPKTIDLYLGSGRDVYGISGCRPVRATGALVQRSRWNGTATARSSTP